MINDTRKTQRQCLHCNRMFPSNGPGNRRCLTCTRKTTHMTDMSARDNNMVRITRAGKSIE